MLIVALSNCVQSHSDTFTLVATGTSKPSYTPIVVTTKGTRLPKAAELVAVQDLIGYPERYADKFVEVHGVHGGLLEVPAIECWIRPPWEWRLDAEPSEAAREHPSGIDAKNAFGDMLSLISNAEGYTIRNPYGKRVAVWGWWRLYTGPWGCPLKNALGTPEPFQPHWYLDAVQLQFLESIEVIPPQQ